MRHIAPIARILLGLAFVVFATNYFIPFLPAQPPPGPGALAFVGAFASAGLLTFIKVIELAAGLALLANRAVPLALALLAPIIVGILGFHAALAPAGLAVPVVLLVLELVLAWSYRSAFAPMLRLKVAPDPVAPAVRVPSLATR
jgi:putative oxidoreductase